MDERIRELQRAARAGDTGATRALASLLLRTRRLTVHDLVELGEPAAEAIPEVMRRRLVNVVAPRIWTVIHTWEDPGRGSQRVAFSYLSKNDVHEEAATRAINVVDSLLDYVENEEEALEDLERARSLVDSEPVEAWYSARSALYLLRDYDDEENEIEIESRRLM